MLNAELGHEPKTLLELEAMCCRASAKTNKTATKRYGHEVVYDDVFHALLAERRKTGSKSQRAQISKSIRKHLRRALREQRNGRIKHVLDEFKDLDRLTHHARAPVYPCPTRKSKSKSKPGRRVAGPFWAQAVNQKRQYLQIRIYKSLHFRQCRSCRKSQKVPTMLFCPVRIPSNARVVCSDRRL